MDSIQSILDLPLFMAFSYCISLFDNVFFVASYLAIGIGLIGILWNAFRLWFGTQQVKKACIDICSKFLIYTFLASSYSLIVNGLLSFAMSLGVGVGNGYLEIVTQMTRVEKDLQNQYTEGLKVLDTYFTNLSAIGMNVSVETLDKLAAGLGVSDKDIRAIIEKNNVDINTKINYIYDEGSEKAIEEAKKNQNKLLRGVKRWVLSSPLVYTLRKLDREWGIANDVQQEMRRFYMVCGTSTKLNLADSINNEKGKILQRKIKAMEKLCGRQPKMIDDPDNPGKQIKKLDENGNVVYKSFYDSETGEFINYFYDPYTVIKGLSNEEVAVLMPSSFIKIGLFWATMIWNYESTDVDEDGMIIERGFFSKTLNSIFTFIILLIMVLGIIASTCFATVQYTTTILEYFIVGSLGYIFVPFVLFDGTKSYAAKLITMFSSFFIKLLVMIVCLFFTFNIYMTIYQSIFEYGQCASLISFCQIIFVMLIGFMLTQNAPQIAQTMLTGTPQLSMGEFIHAAATMGAGAAMAKKGAKAAGGVAKAGVGIAAGGIGGVAAGVNAFKGAKAGGASGFDAFKAGVKTTGNQWTSGILNKGAKMIGLKNPVMNNHIGGTFKGADMKSFLENNEGSAGMKLEKDQVAAIRATATADGKLGNESMRLIEQFKAQNQNTPSQKESSNPLSTSGNSSRSE